MDSRYTFVIDIGSMLYEKVKSVFVTERQATELVERIVWGVRPICPFCRSHNNFFIATENRHHCNTCNSRFSVMASTPFRKSKLDLRKWFTVLLMADGVSVRTLADEINITKDTANLMLKKIKSATAPEREFLEKVAQEVHILIN